MTRRARQVFIAVWIGGALLGMLGQLAYLGTAWRWAAGVSALGLAVMMVQIIRLFLFQAKGITVFRRGDDSGGHPERLQRDDETTCTGTVGR
jgi:hypothetical protein